MDLRLYEAAVRRIKGSKISDYLDADTTSKNSRYNSENSLVSSSSVNTTMNPAKLALYHQEVYNIAEGIFHEYLSLDAPYMIVLEDRIRCNLYQKFGCRRQYENQLNSTNKYDPMNFDTADITPEVLTNNLHSSLF